MKEANLKRVIEISEELIGIAKDEGLPADKLLDLMVMSDGYVSLHCGETRLARVEGLNEKGPVWTLRNEDSYILFENGLFEAPTGEIKL